jgi:hypothetical protein
VLVVIDSVVGFALNLIAWLPAVVSTEGVVMVAFAVSINELIMNIEASNVVMTSKVRRRDFCISLPSFLRKGKHVS